MQAIVVGCIVEGHGEEQAVPILIRRIAENINSPLYLEIKTFRVSKGDMKSQKETLENAVAFLANRYQGNLFIVILADADNDCPAQLAPQLSQKAVQKRNDIPVKTVLAKWEYECWFIAAAESIGGKHGLNDNLTCPKNPELIQGAKQWLTTRMQKGQTYEPVRHQPKLTALFDLNLARQRSPSFDKFYRDIESILLKKE